jgi:hypothetical protein
MVNGDIAKEQLKSELWLLLLQLLVCDHRLLPRQLLGWRYGLCILDLVTMGVTCRPARARQV